MKEINSNIEHVYLRALERLSGRTDVTLDIRHRVIEAQQLFLEPNRYLEEGAATWKPIFNERSEHYEIELLVAAKFGMPMPTIFALEQPNTNKLMILNPDGVRVIGTFLVIPSMVATPSYWTERMKRTELQFVLFGHGMQLADCTFLMSMIREK